MVVQLVIVGLLVALCAATDLNYPKENPCVLISVESNNSLSWTPASGSAIAVPVNFTEAVVVDGSCSDTGPFLEIFWESDNGTMRFEFKNTSGKVDLDMTVNFVPAVTFGDENNTDKSLLPIAISMEAGSVDTAFKCIAEQIKFSNKMQEGDKYTLTLRFKQLTVQGFGVENGVFSKDTEECVADKPTPSIPPFIIKTSTTTTTTSPNTTKTSTTTTTTSPNTTTTSTTTTSPTTTKPSTTKPSTTTTGSTTPAKPTTAAPLGPTKVTLKATDGNITCAMLVGKMTLLVPYHTNKTGKTKIASVIIPKNISSTGNCTAYPHMDTLTAKFFNGWEMVFRFGSDGHNIWWDYLNVTVVFDPINFPDINSTKRGKTDTFFTNFTAKFNAKMNGSYLCNSEMTTTLVRGLKLKTTDLQYTALQANVSSFSDKHVTECSADQPATTTSSIVPIAVGAGLAALVVIVLVGFLIIRRRRSIRAIVKSYETLE